MNTKVLVAAGFAIAGACVAGYSFATTIKKEKPGERLHQVTRDMPDRSREPKREAPTLKTGGDAADTLASAAASMPDAERAEPKEPANFPVVKNDDDVVSMLGGFEEHIAGATTAIPEVTALGAQASQKLSAATRTALEPLFLGSRNKVIEAVKALGGTPPDPNAPPPNGPDGQPLPGPRGGPGGSLVNLLKHASIDFSRAKVIPAMVNGKDLQREAMQANMRESGAVSTSGSPIPGTTPAPGAPGSENGTQERSITLGSGPPRADGGPANGGAPRPGADRMVMKMMQRGMYPDVENPIEKKLTVVEVRAPILLEGETAGSKNASDIDIGINMAWNPTAQQWQPAGFTLYPKDQASMMKVAAAMKAAQAG